MQLYVKKKDKIKTFSDKQSKDTMTKIWKYMLKEDWK